MKLKRVSIYYSIIAITLLLSSCQDMFNPEVDNTYGEERALSFPQFTLGFLNTAYLALPTTYDFSECTTDDAVMNDPTSGFLAMVGGSWSPMFDPTAIWSSSYRAIANINKFMTYVPTMKISWSSTAEDSLYRK